jgi:hypothetical protein
MFVLNLHRHGFVHHQAQFLKQGEEGERRLLFHFEVCGVRCDDVYVVVGGVGGVCLGQLEMPGTARRATSASLAYW